MDDSGRASEGSNPVPNNGLIEPANQPIFSQGIWLVAPLLPQQKQEHIYD